MNGEQLFDLEKIKEITNPIEGLQGNLFELEENHGKFNEIHKNFSEVSHNEVFLDQLQYVAQLLEDINRKMIKLSNANLKKLLVFQDNLIKKYKETFKDNLKGYILKFDEDEFENTKEVFLINGDYIKRIEIEYINIEDNFITLKNSHITIILEKIEEHQK